LEKEEAAKGMQRIDILSLNEESLIEQLLISLEIKVRN